jgi:hypothetical protein
MVRAFALHNRNSARVEPPARFDFVRYSAHAQAMISISVSAQ